MRRPQKDVSEDALPWWKRETLMSRVDSIATESPNKIYAAYPRSPLTYDKGFREITYSELANAVNGIAHLLKRLLPNDKPGQTLAYIGPNDIRYPALILGAAKLGHKLLLISPRNSIAAQFHLFEATGCSTILSPSPEPPQVAAIRAAKPIQCVQIPGVIDLLDQPPEHTSGSTGMPKALIVRHQYASNCIEHGQRDPPPGYESQDRMYQKNRVFVTFPPFHGAFLACHLFNAIPHGTVTVAPTSGAIATGQGLVDALKHTHIDVPFLVPSIVLDLANDPALLDTVAQKTERILYCGGDLPQQIGDGIAAKMPLYNQYGASEMGLVPQIWGNRTSADWKYIEPHPDIGVEMRHTAGDMYEYTVVRQPVNQEQPAAFACFPDLDVYGSRDLYVRHPTNPKLWKWKARVDDVIVFLNGEKTNPISMEQYIVANNKNVSRALVAGSQRFQAALVIEPLANTTPLSTSQRARFIEDIWPSIDQANQVCPAHARVAKSYILFTTPEKPMMVAGKGTVQRAGTLALYKHELDKLYADADVATAAEGDSSGLLTDLKNHFEVHKFLKQAVLAVTSWKNIQDNDNFFTLGMDSLQALSFLRRLRNGLELPGLAVAEIYANPDLSSLTQAILNEASASTEHKAAQSQDAIQKMKQYLADMPQVKKIDKSVNRKPQGAQFILTGSTGTLGCHLLDILLSMPDVLHIHCLNRSSDGAILQEQRLAARGLDTAKARDPRVTYYNSDLSNPDLGLTDHLRRQLSETITHVIHGAWPVNFNQPLSAFEPHLRGIVNLHNVVASGIYKVKFMFISTGYSTASYRTANGKTPETIIDDFTAPGPIGYTQSKFLDELLLGDVSKRVSAKDHSFAIARVGQVGGAIQESLGKKARANESATKESNGHGPDANAVTWNKAEWFPSLVVSSVHIGALPDTLGIMNRIDWVPMDVLAQIVLELTLSPDKDSSEILDGEPAALDVFHPQNTHIANWTTISSSVLAEIEALTGKKLDVVPAQEWLNRVQKAMEAGADDKVNGGAKAIDDGDLATLLKVNPAAKLLDWYKATLMSEQQGGKHNVLETTKTAEKSKTLRELGPIQGAWIRKWVGEWLRDAGLERVS